MTLRVSDSVCVKLKTRSRIKFIFDTDVKLVPGSPYKKIGYLWSKVEVFIEVKVKNKKCGKLDETHGKLKISFSKFPSKSIIFGGLGHFFAIA